MSGKTWRRASRDDLSALEIFLRSRESRALGLIGRILREGRLRLPNPLRGGLWICEPEAGRVEGALLSSPARVFFPQLPASMEADAELAALLGRDGGRPASIIGPASLVERLERALSAEPRVAQAYRLMQKAEPGPAGERREPPRPRPPGLLLSRVGPPELEAILPLQSAYEQEEVITSLHRFDAEACRAALAQSLAEQSIVAAFAEGRPVGKAGTNAHSFGLDQVGGVYVLPELRGRGVGRALMECLLGLIEGRGRRAVLFVKTRNEPACALYRSLGFEEIDDFRADYFEA